MKIKIQCPSCKNQFMVEGKSSEKIYITCPKCKTHGSFTFPAGKCDPNKIQCFSDLGDVRFKKLRIFNGVMGIIHMIQGFLILMLSNAFTLPLTYTHPEYNAVTKTISPVSETFFNIQIGPLVALFFFYVSNSPYSSIHSFV